MKCPKEIRLCPNGWEDCSDCKFDVLCGAGLYEPGISDLGIVVLAAKIAEEAMHAVAVGSAEGIKRGTWMEELDQVTGTDEFWAWFNKGIRPGDINHKEPLKGGPPKFGGGSKSRVKKSKAGNKIFTDVWSGF